ncbi:MAG TPA: class D sortase [Bacillales bacterium]|nr:class D sortase [Bacillales bacterium]
MLKKGSFVLIAIGLLLIGVCFGKAWLFHQKVHHVVQETKQQFALKNSEKHPVSNQKQMIKARESIPVYQKGDVIGILDIPEADIEFPIYQGISDKELSAGAGHYVNTDLPGGNDQIVIPAHNTTEFARIGKLKEGDLVQIKTEYGDFQYQVNAVKIVEEEKVNIIHGTAPNEVLVLFTCYPFTALWHSDQRYVVFAEKVNQVFYQVHL